MSQMTKEINAITGTIIGVSGKLIVYALVILLLVEGMTRGYAFGHDIFYSPAVAAKPGVSMRVTIGEGEEVADIASALERGGLIRNKYAFIIQSIFYDYGGSDNPVEAGTYLLNNSMTSKEILQVLNEKPDSQSGEEGAEEQ